MAHPPLLTVFSIGGGGLTGGRGLGGGFFGSNTPAG